MSAIRLLVLGAVRRHGRAHGYQVRNDLEFWGADEWSNTKPGSIYHALKQLAKQGLLHAYETGPSTAGGPPRTEYEVTEKGTAEYFSLLRGALTAHDKLDLLSAGLGFIADLTRQEALDLLRRRVANLEAWRAAADHGRSDLGHIGEITNLWVHSAEAGAEWTRGLIGRIEGGAYAFAGEGGDPFHGVLAD
ncbi:DNA-binding transcriptional regulator, PadR family [Nonomuraea solani]|uniref:DNA-binding transcriptional regulator, PadR family n=1 Tax=Nonomuraea solani TaxID=1144553 RepID=A0A1H6EA28_9ACTN|nr:PadR family transcriptional regulator [Nonomuraea solani]SEG94131.1 DNA-binding transcriptional regulator, PadR family [Nonomuraea solani]